MASGAKRWELPPPVTDNSLPSHVPPAIAKVLVRRGIDSADKLRVFFDPPQRLPYDPLRLAGMEQALRRIYQAISHQELVGIFGDFDVDGVTGTAIIAEGLKAFGLRVLPYLPHRTEEGHGLSKAAVRHLVDQGVTLIVTVDCGVTSWEEVGYASQLGSDTIITDHHLPQSDLPDAAAIINPQLPGGGYPFFHLCGAGLAFKLAQGLYQFHGQPWDRSLLELAAMGTIADLVPLLDENRYLVQEGLAALAQTQRPGLQALFRVAGIQPGPLTTETVSFQVSPRLNSPGRLGHSMDSFRLLTTTSSSEAQALAEKLEGLNRRRRELTEVAMKAAHKQVLSRAESAGLPAVLLVSGPEISQGLAGLVAGRLAETFRRPAVAMAVEDDYVVGSGRSIPEFDIFEAFSSCQDLFVRFGGHSQAAGFTLAKEKLPLLEERLTEVAEQALAPLEIQPTLAVDVEVGLDELSGDLRRWLSRLEPFGAGNPQPVFLTRRARVLGAQYVGKTGQHVKFKVTQGNEQETALAFNQADRWLDGTSEVDLVYSLMFDRWQGTERLTLKVLDFQPAES
jgi:single-stranded-DNA-specific exonuclease